MTATLTTLNRGLFPAGRVLIIPGALNAPAESGQQPGDFLVKHLQGDWGELCEADRAANQEALEQGLRLLSACRTSKGQKLWIITEADRAATTLLLPEEY
jgi:hypothetical protein